DAENIYEIPLVLHAEGLDDYVCRLLHFDGPEHAVDLSSWEGMVDRIEAATTSVRIGLIGKYVNLPDAYLSVVEALRHAPPRHRSHGRAGRGDRPRWHHAAGLLHRPPATRLSGRRRLRRARGVRASPPPLRGQPPLPDAARGG